jgi:metal-dependent amidase/aminoacylase/carboxypeptidase family protein
MDEWHFEPVIPWRSSTRERLDGLERKLDQILEEVKNMATTQAELDAYITGTLQPLVANVAAAVASLQTLGTQIQADVEALLASSGSGEDLTPQLTELQTQVASLNTSLSTITSDVTAGTAFAGTLTPTGATNPAPTTLPGPGNPTQPGQATS